MLRTKPRTVEHEITLVALTRHEDGSKSIVDIVETSNHFASKFIRSWMRDPLVNAVATMRPGVSCNDWHEPAIRTEAVS